MNVQLFPELSVEPTVIDFIQAHNAQGALETACAVIRDSFPELRSIRVRLVEDPDEEDHTWILLKVLLPGADAVESAHPRGDRFYEELNRQLPLPYHPFSFSLEIAPE
jgi:hypothetical protein